MVSQRDCPEISARKVLVTGATGFVGVNLVEALLRRGYSVTCLVRSTSDVHALRNRPIRLITGDLDDPAALREAVRAIHIVYHLAGLIKAADRASYFRINQAGTRHLLEALAEANPNLNRFVHVSSLAAAGPSTGAQGLTEKDPPNPISWYGESKLGSEREVLRYRDAYPVTILRPSAVYGPGDRETLLVFRMIQWGCLLTPGYYERRFSLIHVDDLAEAIILAGECSTPSGEIFFVSRPEAYTWGDVGRAIARAVGRRFRRVSFPRWMAVAAGYAGDLFAGISGRAATINSQKVRELLQSSWLCDSSKARSGLEFTPAIDLENGVLNTARWYRDHGWL